MKYYSFLCRCKNDNNNDNRKDIGRELTENGIEIPLREAAPAGEAAPPRRVPAADGHEHHHLLPQAADGHVPAAGGGTVQPDVWRGVRLRWKRH